jgi:hypothetical protein
MKTKELIKLLQEEDPTGETDVCVGNLPITYVCIEPAYYDGRLQRILDNNKGEYVSAGSKVVINYTSFSDIVIDNQEFEIDYSALGDHSKDKTKEHHEELRQWSKKLDLKMLSEAFVKWAKTKASILSEDIEEVGYMASNFLISNLDKIDFNNIGKVEIGQSFSSTREKYWDSKFEITLDDGFWKIKEKA